MDLSRMLDVAIGLIFVFLLLSILASWIQESIAALLKTRSKDLVRTIERLFNPNLAKTEGVKKLETTFQEGLPASGKLKRDPVKAVYEHPLIRSLCRSPKAQPSYIAAREFSVALVDLVVASGSETDSDGKEIDKAEAGIKTLDDIPGKKALTLLAERAKAISDDAEEQIAAFRENVEDWYDSTMERATGWYKRKMHWWAVVIGLAIAIACNVDTLHLVSSLWNDSALRAALVADAGQQVGQEQEISPREAWEELGKLPIGWQGENTERLSSFGAWLLWILGIVLTGVAVSAGSPFWFDVLKQFVNVRSTGLKPATSASVRTASSSAAKPRAKARQVAAGYGQDSHEGESKPTIGSEASPATAGSALSS